jgi:hypothetical protein
MLSTKVGENAQMDEILKDFPPGPLDRYRNAASFDWKQMKVYFEGENVIKKKVREYYFAAIV